MSDTLDTHRFRSRLAFLEASADHVRDLAALEREHGLSAVFELIRARAFSARAVSATESA